MAEALTLCWQYSRNQLRHWVTDGNLYRDGKPHPSGHELFVIKTDRHQSVIRKPTDTFRLLHKGRLMGTSKKVKALKAIAECLHNK